MTGWLPHTTRAALTGLRKRGFVTAIDRSDKERGSIYCMERGPAAEDSTTPHSRRGSGRRRGALEEDAPRGETQGVSSGVTAMRRPSGDVGAASPLLTPQSDNAGSVEDVIAGLADLDAKGLRLQWRNHLGGASPGHLPRWLLRRVLAYQFQVAALGGLDKAKLRVIRQPKGRTLDSAGSGPFEARIGSTREGPISERARYWSGSGRANWKG